MNTRRLALLSMLLALVLAACAPAAQSLVEPNKDGGVATSGDGSTDSFYGNGAPQDVVQTSPPPVARSGARG